MDITNFNTKMRNIWQSFKTIILSINVEPICFLIFASYLLGDTVLPEAQKQKFLKMYSNELSWNASDQQREDLVQDKIIYWNMYTAAANLPIAMLVTIVLGALGDKYGRQMNILFGIASQTVMIFGRFFVFTQSINPPFWLSSILFYVFCAFLGDYYIAYISGQAFMADHVSDKNLLTIRLTVLSIFRSLGAFAGTQLAGWWGEEFGFDTMMTISLCLSTFAFFYTLWFIPQIPPKQIELEREGLLERESINGDSENTDETNSEITDKISFATAQNFLKQIGTMVKETGQAFVKKREGRKRLYLLVCAVVQFVTMLSLVDVFRLVGVYTLRSPLCWGPNELGQWISSGIVLSSLGNIIGILLMKKVLKFNDTTIIILGLLSQSLYPIPMAFATSNWFMYLSNVLAMLSGVTQPTLASFTSTLVAEHELGKIYTSFAMASFVAIILQQFAMQEVYLWTLNFFPGFIWLLGSFLSFLCLTAMIIVHILSKNDQSMPH